MSEYLLCVLSAVVRVCMAEHVWFRLAEGVGHNGLWCVNS